MYILHLGVILNILSSSAIDLVLGYYMPLIIFEPWSCTITLQGKRPWENESCITGKEETEYQISTIRNRQFICAQVNRLDIDSEVYHLPKAQESMYL